MRRILVGLVGAALLAGCTPEAPATSSPAPTPSVESSAPAPSVEAPSPSPSASPSESPSPSQSPSPTAVESFPPAPATETPEQAEIRAAWMKYWDVRVKFTSDPTLNDLTETQQVTTGEASQEIIETITALRSSDRRSLGGYVFRDVVVGVPPTSSAESSTTEISYCVDRSEQVVLDSSGQEQPIVGPTTLREVTTLQLEADGVWRVMMSRNEAAEC